MEPVFKDLIDRINQLSGQIEELREGVRMAAEGADRDPEMALIRSRKMLEYVVRDVFVRRVGEPPGTRPLEGLIQRLVKDSHFPHRLEAYSETIRKLGNVGAHHFGQRISAGDVYLSLTQLMPILEWYFEIERPEAGVKLEIQLAKSKPETKGSGQTNIAHVAVVPKGLRSFDANDSEFFLQLLPGPRDKDSLPESIRFWKNRIETIDEPAFTVGVIYGPSGCGKSSLVKAGLLPRLAGNVVAVIVEATPGETEVRLLNGLRRKFPELPSGMDLTHAIVALRQEKYRKPRQKLVVVVDQFEQWLHSHRSDQESELARALRQSDGDHVQCILMVRDDFWVALTRFMGQLSIEILQGQNAALIDLFDPIHARKVLAEIGQSFGHLPNPPLTPSKEQETFLDTSVKGLSKEGRVVPIRLALFAEMFKGRSWTPAMLKEVGGTEGIGVAFLEETFNSASLRTHLNAAQMVLKALLPASGTDIKGRMRSYEELVDAAGAGVRPEDFDSLLRKLDGEAHLITPTDPEGRWTSELKPSQTGSKHYQLTHDYLVPALRDWLSRKQRETRQGRAELRLAERSATWNARPENRQLPSLLEWANIRSLTRWKDWTEAQRRMMRRAGQVYALRGLVLAITFACLVITGLTINHRVAEANRATHAAGLVQQLVKAESAQVPEIVKAMQGYRSWTDPELRRMVDDSTGDPRSRLHARLALLPVDTSQVPFLEERLMVATPSELPVLRDSLGEHRSKLTPKLWDVLSSVKPSDPALLRAAAALALYDPESPRWHKVGDKVALSMSSINPVYLSPWLDTLRPVRVKLISSLTTISHDLEKPESHRIQATDILSDFGSDNPNLLASLLLDCEEASFSVLYERLSVHQDRAAALMESEVAKVLSSEGKDDEIELMARRKAMAAVALMRLERTESVWPLLRHSSDPSVRSFLVNWMKLLGVDPNLLLAKMLAIISRLDDEDVNVDDQAKTALFHLDISILRAVILALGKYEIDDFPSKDQEFLVAKLVEVYCNNPDAGVHGAAEWTLRRWKKGAAVGKCDQELQKLQDRGQRRWYSNSQGQVLIILRGPFEFLMGSPPGEPGHFDTTERLRKIKIDRSYAISAKEVTVAQFNQFAKTKLKTTRKDLATYSPEEIGPMNGPSWYEAAEYCNWLSEQEGLDKNQRCYEPNIEGKYAEGMRIVPGALGREGYRLPTEAEWEYACRAGAATSRYFGRSADLLKDYAWYLDNSRAGGSKERAWPCGQLEPNDFGIFDMLGNVYEWCLDSQMTDDQAEVTIDGHGLENHSILSEKNPRAVKGGSCTKRAVLVRSAYRNWYQPSYVDVSSGFRIVKSVR